LSYIKVRGKALKFVEELAKRWTRSHRSLTEEADGGIVSVRVLLDALSAVYAIERCGVKHELKIEVQALLNSGSYSVSVRAVFSSFITSQLLICWLPVRISYNLILCWRILLPQDRLPCVTVVTL
jgi:hypothetical protein